MALPTTPPPAYHGLSLFKIQPTYPVPDPLSSAYIETIQGIVDDALPPSLFSEAASLENTADLGSLHFRMSKALPIVKYPDCVPPGCAFPITLIIPAEYTHGAGRYVADTLCRWLIPGKQVIIVGQFCLNFHFERFPSMTYFAINNCIVPPHPEDLAAAIQNLPRLVDEMRINIMAVYHARHITSLRSSSHRNQRLIIEENLSSILNKKEEIDNNLYDKVQLYLGQLSDEDKINQIKKNISYLLSSRPKVFDRDLFYEIAQYSSLFSPSFKRNPRHLSRVIAYQYLFKKVLVENMKTAPLERHLSLKIFLSRVNQTQPVISLLAGFNFLNENERFEIKHLMEAVRICSPQAVCIPGSTVVDRRSEKVRFFYLELSNEAVTQRDIKALKGKLSQEILRQIEHTMHPVFMPRNDEELIRNLVMLSKQIQYVRDLPQVSIHYETQSESDLSFTVILVRLMRNPSEPLHKLLAETDKSVKFDIEDIRNAGYLKNKYPKEAAILRIALPKSPFFRPDFSVDLLRARQKISAELTRALGEFRDFNGGIILKQEESLSQLRKSCGPLSERTELLLENYFYSLRPGIMQTVYESTTLKAHFELFLSALSSPLRAHTHLMLHRADEKYSLYFIKAFSPSFKDPAIDAISALQIPSYDLSSAFIQAESEYFLGLILRLDGANGADLFESKIKEALQSWSGSLACSITGSGSSSGHH